MMANIYTNYPVIKTISLEQDKDIDFAISEIIKAYIVDTKNFSFRLLLPRSEGSNYKAKRMGYQIQLKLINHLKQNRSNPKWREIRYIHDDNHFGWLLLSEEKNEKIIQDNMKI